MSFPDVLEPPQGGPVTSGAHGSRARADGVTATAAVESNDDASTGFPDPNTPFEHDAPVWGWQFDCTRSAAFEASAEDLRRRADLEARLQVLVDEEGRIDQIREEQASPRAKRSGALRSAAIGLLLLIIGLALGGDWTAPMGTTGLLALIISAVYFLPYWVSGEDRQKLVRHTAERRFVETSLQAGDARVAEIRLQYEGRQRELVRRTTRWTPIPCPDGVRRVDVIGGTKVGWEAFAVTFGASVLGTGERLLVLDLSERLVATHLARLAMATGRSVRRFGLPTGPEQGIDLFAGVPSEQMIECIVAAWHDSESQHLGDQLKDGFVLERLVSCLEPSRQLTVSRLYAAVSAMLLPGNADGGGGRSDLADDEVLRLQRLFDSQVRASAAFTDRLMAFAAFLGALRRINDSSHAHSGPIVSNHDLVLMELAARAPTADKVALGSTLIQVLQRLHAAPDGRALPNRMLIAGADCVSRRSLERLADLAADAGVQVTLMFQSMSSEGAEASGSGDSVQLFMRLGNRKDAERAAEHLGRSRQFLLSQYSTNENDSVTETYGEQASRSSGASVGVMSLQVGRVPLLLPSVTGTSGSSHGTSWGKSTAKTRGTAETYNRVHELVVEPEAVQMLGQYVFLVRQGRDLVIAGECDPELAYWRSPSSQEPSTGRVEVNGGPAQTRNHLGLSHADMVRSLVGRTGARRRGAVSRRASDNRSSQDPP